MSNHPVSSLTSCQAPFSADWPSLLHYKIPTWYEDAKFGIFIHWGVYSVPAFRSEWYPRNMYKSGSPEFEHHIATYGPHAQFGYKDFIPQLTGSKFDAAEWADLFKKSGAKYVMPVAEHHDGFAMYDSSFTRWKATEMGPKRDVVGELAEAVRAEGMVFTLSSHRAENWFFFNGGREFDSDVNNPEFADLYGPAQAYAPPPPSRGSHKHDRETQPFPDEAFLEGWLGRTCELVDKYRPQVVWFDWWIHHVAFEPYLQKFAAYYYNRGIEWGIGVAINYKYHAFPEGSAVFDIERGQLDGIRPLFWQTDTAVSKSSWGYTRDQEYKTACSVIGDLVDIVSKNGSLLLNVGPRSDGSIPEEDKAILLEIGTWLAVNGEAIYGTRPWTIFGEGPTQVAQGAFSDTMRKDFTSEDIRFTAKGDTLYAIVLAWPESGEVFVKSLPESARKVKFLRLLGSPDALAWRQTAEWLSVTLPAARPCEHAFALEITLEVEPTENLVFAP